MIEILRDAKKLAREYHSLTGKPLGVTGEVAEYEAAQLLGITLTAARQAGYDAIDATGKLFQIKGRRVLNKRSQNVGKIDIRHEWDAVLLVLLDNDFNATIIYEAPRAIILEALQKPGSKARNERGQLAVSTFKSIATIRWTKD